MSVEVRVYIPCANEGCTNDTESYKVYDSEGKFLEHVEDAYEIELSDEKVTHKGITYTKVIYVCSVICKEQVITRSKEMAR